MWLPSPIERCLGESIYIVDTVFILHHPKSITGVFLWYTRAQDVDWTSEKASATCSPGTSKDGPSSVLWATPVFPLSVSPGLRCKGRSFCIRWLTCDQHMLLHNLWRADTAIWSPAGYLLRQRTCPLLVAVEGKRRLQGRHENWTVWWRSPFIP